MSVKLTWRGDQVVRAVTAAAKLGIDQTMSAAVIDSKQNHPGWRNRTGAAEGSMRTLQQAEERGALVEGRWGSMGVGYMIWLELKNGSALRTSADRNYPALAGRIKRNMEAMRG